VQLLLDAGAKIDAKDMNGDSPLSWASWHVRPDGILRKLCYGGFRIHPARRSMEANLVGQLMTHEAQDTGQGCEMAGAFVN
jgi:hypothetical protein